MRKQNVTESKNSEGHITHTTLPTHSMPTRRVGSLCVATLVVRPRKKRDPVADHDLGFEVKVSGKFGLQ